MKNSVILKDELRLLSEDRSAVLIELRRASSELNDTLMLISIENKNLAEVRNTISETTARLDDLRSRAVFLKSEIDRYTQDLRNIQNTWEATKVKNSIQLRTHLGRIKELQKEEEIQKEKNKEIKEIFDNNHRVYSQTMSELNTKIRSLEKDKDTLSKDVSSLIVLVDRKREEEKKLTKDRLKREDKIRIREKNSDAKENSLKKMEDDLITMSKDMSVIYRRLKELYSKVDPTVDLDKLIIKV